MYSNFKLSYHFCFRMLINHSSKHHLATNSYIGLMCYTFKKRKSPTGQPLPPRDLSSCLILSGLMEQPVAIMTWRLAIDRCVWLVSQSMVSFIKKSLSTICPRIKTTTFDFVFTNNSLETISFAVVLQQTTLAAFLFDLPLNNMLYRK